MTKTHKIKFRNVKSSGHTAEKPDSLAAETSTNLREEGKEVLRVCGLPREIARLPDGYRLAAVDIRNGVENFIVSKGKDLVHLGYRSPGQKYFITGINRKIVTFNGNILGCISNGDFLIVSTTEGIEYIRYDGEYHPLDISGCIPEIAVDITETGTTSLKLDAIQFKSSYSSWKYPLYKEDILQISDQLENAYRTTCATARRSGRFIQPTAVRYIVRLADNSVIYTSQPVIIGNGIAGCDDIVRKVIQSNNRYTGIEESVYNLPTFAIGISTVKGTAAEWDGLIKSVDILYCECDEPVHSGEIEYRCNNTQAGSHSPNLSAHLKSKDSEAIAQRIANADNWKLLTRITDLKGLRTGDINAPGVAKSGSYDGRIPNIQLYAIYNRGIYDDTYKSAEIFGKSALFQHKYLGKTDNFSGSVHLYNGTYIPVNPWNPMLSAAGEKAADDAEIVTQITISQNDIDKYIVSRFRIQYSCAALSPLISVPTANASHLKICVKKSNGDVLIFSGNLIPSSDGTYSYYVSSDFSKLPFSIGNIGDFDDIPAQNYVIKLKDKILISLQNNPFVFAYTLSIGDGEPMQLAQAIQPVTGNIFGRFPLYSFTQKGIYAVNTENSGTAPRMISSVIPNCGIAPEHTPNGIIFISGSHLHLLNGAKVSTICDKIHCSGLLYNHANREIFGLSDTGNTTVIQGNMHKFSISENIIYKCGKYGVSAAGGILEINDETEQILQISYLSRPYEINDKIYSVIWEIFGEDLKLKLTLYGEYGESCHGELITEVTLDGDLNIPLKLPVLPKEYRVLRFKIEGTAGTGTAIYPTYIN